MVETSGMIHSQGSESEIVQMTDNALEAKKCSSSPKTSREVLASCKAQYLTGEWKTLKELGDKYGIHHKSLQARIKREGWEHQRNAILSKAESKIENKVALKVDRASSYLDSAYLRARKYEKLIDDSLDQAGGIPDSEMIDQLTRSEARIHELAKSALRIAPISQVDITSKGEGIGSAFVSAMEKLRQAPALSEEQVRRAIEMREADEAAERDGLQ